MTCRCRHPPCHESNSSSRHRSSGISSSSEGYEVLRQCDPKRINDSWPFKRHVHRYINIYTRMFIHALVPSYVRIDK